MSQFDRANDRFQWAWLHPRYWAAWFVYALLFSFSIPPWAIQRRLGAGMGLLAYHLAKRRVDDTRINIELCFPERSKSEREAMVRDVFRQAGIGIFETANAWYKPLGTLNRGVTVIGIEHVRAAINAGKGLIILGAHYSTLDLNGVMAAFHIPVNVVYRPQNNPVLDYMVCKNRERIHHSQISHADMRSLFKVLKKGEILWTAVDQDYGLKQGVMAPFFGHPAATLTATARMASINKSAVIGLHFMRNADDKTYTMLFTPVLNDYPSGDDVKDATLINYELEQLIRRAPTQYMWFHRRFKSQPEGVTPPYSKRIRKWMET